MSGFILSFVLIKGGIACTFPAIVPPRLAGIALTSAGLTRRRTRPGDTMLFEGQDYIGSAPNLAARLCDAAALVGTLIPEDQANNLPLGVYAVAHEPVLLPGFAQPVEVVALAGEPLIDGRYDINEFWTRSPFVG